MSRPGSHVLSEDSESLGLTVGELQSRQNGLVVIAAEHENQADFDPQLDDVIEAGLLIVAGPRLQVDRPIAGILRTKPTP